MIVKGWNNGARHADGNGYGVKINASDRDSFLRREWKTIQLELEGEASPVKVNIDKDGFWQGKCRELISVRIGKWLIKNKFAPWPRGMPPVVNLIPIENNKFRLTY